MQNDDVTHTIVLAIAGALGGIFGGGATALSPDFDRRATRSTMLSSLGFGIVANVIARHFLVAELDWLMAFGIGFLAGLMVIGLFAGVQKLAQAFAKNPRRVLGDIIAGSKTSSESDLPNEDKAK